MAGFSRFILLVLLSMFSMLSREVVALDVFFVHSYHHGYPWVQAYFSAFKDELNPHSLKDFQMDTKRLPESQFDIKAEQALSLIKEINPKLVVVSDDNALKLVGKPALEAGFPVVFLGVNNNPRQYVAMTDKVAGVLERPLFKRSVAELQRIVPNLRKILVLLEDGITSTAIINTSFDGRLHHKIGLTEVDVARVRDFSHWQLLIKDLPNTKYDLIIIGNYARLSDATGKPVPLEVTTEWTSEYSSIPVFAFWRFSVGSEKAVGGLVLSGEHQGRAAASIVNQYLSSGRFPNPLIRTPTQWQYLFSKSELKRWGLRLPKDLLEEVEWLD